MSALGAKSSTLSAITSYATSGIPRASSVAGLLVVSPPETYASRSSDLAALVTYAVSEPIPRASTVAGLVTYSTGTPSIERSLAWTFTLDGHTMYALDLGNQGTFIYDIVTGQWCKFETQGNIGWNMRNGTMWSGANTQGAARIVAGDSTGAFVWELDPGAFLDDGFRDIEHAATGGIVLRSRVFVSMSELRVAASSGILDETDGAAILQLNYSDDGGQTYQGPFTITLQVGSTPDGQQDLKFDSLGSFMAPGRILQLSDTGGMLRIDGVDAMLDSYDEAAERGNPSEGVIEP